MNISYIIPAYNCSEFLACAVDSIYTRNFQKGDEVVICNDGSDDDTANVMEILSGKYPDIRLLHHRTNRGGGAARNTAVTAAENDLIFCLDSDNILKEDSIHILKERLLGEGAHMAAFSNVHFFQKTTGNVVKILTYTQSDNPLSDYLSKIQVPGGDGNYLYTKKAWQKVGGYPEYVHAMDTWGFGLRMAAENCKSILVDDDYYFHRFGHNSYWERCKGLPISIITLQLLLPYFDKIVGRDVKYILKNYTSWYRNIEKKPIRLKKIL